MIVAVNAASKAAHPYTPPRLRHSDSGWIIVNLSTGKAVCEAFKDSNAIYYLNTCKYMAVPTGIYLANLNNQLK